jgi:hypothetical protein
MVMIVMTPIRKISMLEACDRAIDRMLKDVPEADRTKLIFAVVRKAGGVQMTPEFKTCPHCGRNRLPTEAHSGGRFCRSCREWFPEKAVV